ncbi:MAG: tyrosine--tRNA ligase, partial [Bacteriovoracaceae bacterium]|nr:tyrosine--tRNA ligase [Bacteriovoracaceae bacterium]
GETTLAKLLSHETFAKRIAEGSSLGLHEFFYPVLQGMDSVFIKADVELGGTDQKFNVLMGRDYQKNRKMRPQVAMLLPIITGTDGQQKMSKSLHNYIAIQDTPQEQFGKIMSIPDRLMLEYYQYLTNLTASEFALLAQKIQSGALHPNEAKKQLAMQIVQIFYGPQVAQQAREEFERIFAQKEVPSEIPVYEFAVNEGIVDILFNAKLVASKSEARRLIKQNAVSIENQKISQEDLHLDASFDQQIVKAGKRKFLRLKVKV